MSNKNSTELKNRIELVLRESNLKPKEFAEMFGITQGYISRLRKGQSDRVGETLAKFIEMALGYRHEWLMYGRGEIKTAEGGLLEKHGKGRCEPVKETQLNQREKATLLLMHDYLERKLKEYGKGGSDT
jgi:transcriptional regulator with XRE-family HTH domain